MSRELIVSVNGREKKIAIVENERVTEFYIERGEQNQGIVGNIYKGRVMRVLPGMQSAFVDIGLDRDAFLYVTDFFDEEAEFERVSDEEERALNGEMFKDARLQERIMDAVHAVEFDLEDVPSAPVGSLLSEGLNEGGDFQRVADDEEVAQPAARRAQQIEAAHVDHFVDDVAQESSRDFSFQRVSDDEQGLAQAEPVREPPLPGAAKRETAAERRRKKTGVIGRLFKSKKSEDDESAGDSELSSEGTSEAVPDSQASITTGRPHEEFATRRGGRRRRRPSKKPLGAPETNGSNGVDEHPEEEHSDEPIEAQVPEAVEEPVLVSEVESSEIAESHDAAPGQRRPPARGRRRSTP